MDKTTMDETAIAPSRRSYDYEIGVFHARFTSLENKVDKIEDGYNKLNEKMDKLLTNLAADEGGRKQTAVMFKWGFSTIAAFSAIGGMVMSYFHLGAPK